VPRPGLASGVLETGRDVLPSQRKLCARRIDVRKTSIVDENQESFRFYTLLPAGCVEEHATANRQASKCRLWLERAMPSLFTRESYTWSKNFRAIVTLFKRISDECMIARPDRAILQLLTGRKV